MYYIEPSELEEGLGAEKSYERKNQKTHRKNQVKQAHRIAGEPHPRPHKPRVRRPLLY